MAQEARDAPVGRSRSRSSSSTSPASTGVWWESPRQMQAHTPFPSWIPSYAGTFAAGAGLAAAAEHGLHSDDHAWNQTAPSMGGAHGGSSGYRGNFLSLLEAKNVTPEMFEDDVPAAACDYLGVGEVGAAAATNNMAAGAAAGAYGLLGSSVDDPYSPVASSSAPPVRHETARSLPSQHGTSIAGCMPCYDHQEKPPADDSHRQGFGAPTAEFLQQMIPRRVVELQSAQLGYSGIVPERLESSFGVGSLPDAVSFSDYNSNRSSADFMSSNSNRHERDIRPGMDGSSSRSGAATSVTTRRKSEEGVVGGNTKKSKQAASHKTSPPNKPPQVKLGEKITALQQIVSPFGKTDTSSVLFETIEYIKFLHEQIRLFSEPYMTKSTLYKGHIRCRGEEKEEESGTWHDDLRGRGLCLVPVSLTSQAYHDDTLPDCWAPAYRSGLYP